MKRLKTKMAYPMGQLFLSIEKLKQRNTALRGNIPLMISDTRMKDEIELNKNRIVECRKAIEILRGRRK